MKLQAVVEQLQKQQQQQQQQPAAPMDCRERQVPFPKPPFPGQPRAGPAAMAPAVPSGCHPPPGSRPAEQSARNSEEEEEEDDEDDDEEEEDEEDGSELEVPSRESCSALKYFRAPKAAHANQRVASSPGPALGHQQGKEEQGKDSGKHPGATAGRPGWRLEEQLKQVSASIPCSQKLLRPISVPSAGDASILSSVERFHGNFWALSQIQLARAVKHPGEALAAGFFFLREKLKQHLLLHFSTLRR